MLMYEPPAWASIQNSSKLRPLSSFSAWFSCAVVCASGVFAAFGSPPGTEGSIGGGGAMAGPGDGR